MWTFKPPVTGEDELRAELMAERRARKSAERCCKTLEDLNTAISEDATGRENELLGVIEDRDKTIVERDNRIEELGTVVRLREEEIKGLVGIIRRDRERIEAETAIEVTRAEMAARRIQGEQRHQHGFLP